LENNMTETRKNPETGKEEIREEGDTFWSVK